jgi:hypothetical protein
MVLTVEEGKRSFLGAQNARPTTIEMAEATGAEDDGVLGRDRPTALRARCDLRFRHWSTPDGEGGRISQRHMGRTPACVNPDALVAGDGENSTKRSFMSASR